MKVVREVQICKFYNSALHCHIKIYLFVSSKMVV